MIDNKASPCLYEERDTCEQEDFYTRHVMRMTSEELHKKTHIAAELAHRDQLISEAYQLLNQYLEVSELDYIDAEAFRDKLKVETDKMAAYSNER